MYILHDHFFVVPIETKDANRLKKVSALFAFCKQRFATKKTGKCRLVK